MPGTLLLDDWRQSVEDRLNEHIKGLQQSTQSALQAVSQPVQAVQQVDPQGIASRLQSHVEDLIGQSQQALQPIGQGIQQAAGNALQPLGGDTRDQVAQRLQQHVASLVGQPDQGALQTLSQPQVQQADVLGAPSPDTTVQQHDPSPPVQTAGTQLANTPNSSGQVFPLAARPSNTPTATYHLKGGSDLMAPRGTPVLNMQSGRVDEVFTDNGSHTVGGNAVLIHGDDGLDYYYAHFDQPTGLKAGQRVETGEQIGAVGNSGNAYKGGQGETHLHIGIGHGISNGVGAEGGLGENFDAQKLLTDLLPGIGQAATAVKGAVQQAGAAIGAKVGQGQDAFIQSLQPLAQEVANRTGIDPNVMVAIAANETGWGRSQTAQQQNNLFSIQGDGSNGSRWATYSSPTGAFDAFVNLIRSAPRYAQAWADRGDPQKFVDDLRQAGYVADEPGYPAQGWVDQVKSIWGRLPPSSDTSGPSPQRTAAALGGTTSSTQSDVVRAPGAAVRPVLYAGANQPADQTPQGFMRDVPQTLGAAAQGVGGALGAVGETIGGAASALGTTASGAAQGAQRVLNLDEDAGRRQREALAALEANPEAQKRAADIAGSFRPLEPDQVGPREVLGTAGQAILGGVPVGQVRSPEQIRAGQKAATEPITAPLSEALGQVKIPGTNEPVPVLQGLSTMLVEQAFAAPYMIPGALGASTLGGIGARIMGELAPNAPAILTRLGTGAINGGLQNAILAAGEKDADAQSVGMAFLVGAGLGGTMDVGAGVAVDIGRAIVRRMPDIQPVLEQALRSRQRGEVNIDAALAGMPEAAARVSERVRGTADETPGFRAPVAAEDPRVAAEVQPAVTAAERPRSETAPADERVLYHGTSSDYESVRPGQRAFEGENSLGPGHYLATEPGVASSYAERAQNPEGLEGAVGQGANVRKVYAPADMRLFDLTQTGRDLAPPEIARIADVLEQQGGARASAAVDELRYLASIAEPDAKLGGDASPNVVFDAMASRGVEPRTISRLLRQLGYEGVEHIDSLDGAHNVLVFPEATGRLRNAFSGRQGGQASAPFATNLGGAALGGYAGNLATPQDAPLEERLRNIGVGATTGLLGTRAITGSGGARLAEALAGRGERGGFRAPGAAERPTLEDQLLQARARTPEGGAVPPPPPREPTRLSDVHSNPHTLREAGPDATPLTDDELSAHMDRLQEREAAVQSRLDAVDEQLRNPNAKPERPPWAAGWTNNDLVQVARENGVSAYEPNWWEKAGLETGSGEVQRLRQSGIRGPVGGGREPTLGELRAEKNRLVQEQQDLQAAGEQLTTAPAGARFAAPSESGARDLPFDVGTEEGAPHGPYAVEGNGSSGVLADDIVTRNGTSKRPSGLNTLWSEPGQVAGRSEGVTGRGIADAEAAGVGPPSEATLRAMPNLDALLSEEVPPEIRLQIQKAVEDNPELFAAYQQGRISHDSLRDDLARKVGMSTKDWLKTPVGKGFSTPELVALQAAAVDAQHSVMDMATEIMAREGGVDALSPEEVAFSLSNLLDTASLLHVASGARSTQGRSLNALKIRMDRELSRGIAGSNERIAARRTADQARRGALRATQLLNKARDLDAEARQAVNGAREAGMPKNILDQIADAYKQLDAYQSMTLHEKADDFTKLAEARAAAAAKRKAAVREAPEELLSALRQELKAERDNFAKRKNTWEDMAFWDSKSEEKALDRGTAFAGGRYLELQRKAANDAAKLANREAELAWKRASQLESKRSERAKALLERIGGEAPSRELLKAFVQAMASPDPMVAAKFMKGLQPHRTGFAGFVDMVRNANIMRLAGMLSATATHIVNMGGNAIGATLEVPTHGLTIAIDKARAAATGGERQAYGAEIGPMIRGWGRVQGGEGRGLGFLASLPDVLQVLQHGISPAEVADLSKIRPGFRSSDLPVVGFGLGKIPGRAAERVIDPAIEMPLRLLQAEDAMFRGGAFGMHAERVATRQAIRDGFTGAERTARVNNIIANLEDYPELYKEAADSAARMIYQERRTAPGMSGVRLSGTPGEATEAAVSQVLPFRKTPINVTAQGLGMSPLGVAGVLEAVGSRGAIEARVRTGEVPASRLGQQTLLAEQRAARAIIGTGILGAFYMLGTQRDDQGKPKGTLTAMYDENEASTYPQGWRAWSMRTENPANGEIVYTPFQNFGAAGVPMAMAAIAADAERRGKKFWSDDKEMGRAIAGVGRYALDTPFLQGLSDTVDLFHDPGRAGTKFVEGLVSSYGPYSGMGRQVQRAYGVASRNPREGWNMLLDALEADYPGLSGNVPEATTALGEPRTPGATGFGSIVGRYDIERDEPTLKALRENDVNVPAAPKSVSLGSGYGIELTEAEQDTLKRARGAAIRQSVEQTIGNPRFQQADLASRNLNLRMVVSAAASKANDDFLRRMSRDEIRQRQKVMREVEPSPLGAG